MTMNTPIQAELISAIRGIHAMKHEIEDTHEDRTPDPTCLPAVGGLHPDREPDGKSQCHGHGDGEPRGNGSRSTSSHTGSEPDGTGDAITLDGNDASGDWHAGATAGDHGTGGNPDAASNRGSGDARANLYPGGYPHPRALFNLNADARAAREHGAHSHYAKGWSTFGERYARTVRATSARNTNVYNNRFTYVRVDIQRIPALYYPSDSRCGRFCQARGVDKFEYDPICKWSCRWGNSDCLWLHPNGLDRRVQSRSGSKLFDNGKPICNCLAADILLCIRGQRGLPRILVSHHPVALPSSSLANQRGFLLADGSPATRGEKGHPASKPRGGLGYNVSSEFERQRPIPFVLKG